MAPIDRYLNYPRGRTAVWSEDGTRLVRPDGGEFPILGAAGAAKDQLLADASAGLISPDVNVIKTAYHTTPGDEGGARYRRVTAAQLAAYGMATKPLALTVASGALTLTNAHHGADIELTGVGNGISLDAATVYDGFRVIIRNHRGTDWRGRPSPAAPCS